MAAKNIELLLHNAVAVMDIGEERSLFKIGDERRAFSKHEARHKAAELGLRR